MGLFGAMTASVSGLAAQGQAISVISDNLANTNTIGYKASRALFSQLVTSSGVSGTEYNAGGLDTSVRRDQSTQGSLTSSNSVTDLAISGNGFFRVADTAEIGTNTTYYYTRAGGFTENKEGFLVTANGYFLQGWRTDSDGNIDNLQNLVNIGLQSVGVSAQATRDVTLGINLNSTVLAMTALYDTNNPLAGSLEDILASTNENIYLSDVRVYDSQGTARDITLAFSKRANNLWDWQLYTDGSNIQGGTEGVETLIDQGIMQFNPGGTLKYATRTDPDTGALLGNTSVTANWAGGVNPSTINFNFGDFSGGKIVTGVSDELGFQSLTEVTAHTDTAPGDLGTLDPVISTTPLPAGTYTLQRVSATQIALYDGATLISTAAAGATTGAQTFTFANGLTMDVDADFDMDTVVDGNNIGTITVAGTGAGGVYSISVENEAMVNDTYTLQYNSVTGNLELLDGASAVVATLPISDVNAAHEIVMENSANNIKVRIALGENFDETPAGASPVFIGTFTVGSVPALNEGLANNGVIQFSSSFNTSFINQNGFASGNLSAIQIDENGYVAGTFTNGETKKLYKIALAVFQNPRGLEAVSGSLLRVTDTSGQALIKEAGNGGTGRIVSGALEGSTTDIANEFSQMIVAQRAFQASSTVITTVDQMLQNLLQIR